MEPEPVLGWVLVGNIVPEGTKHFVGGTKIYLWSEHDNDRIDIVGRHRGGSRLVGIMISRNKTTNWRVKPVYSKGLFNRLWGRSKEETEELLIRFLKRISTETKNGKTLADGT